MARYFTTASGAGLILGRNWDNSGAVHLVVDRSPLLGNDDVIVAFAPQEYANMIRDSLNATQPPAE